MLRFSKVFKNQDLFVNLIQVKYNMLVKGMIKND